MNTLKNGELFLERYRIDDILGEGGFGTVYAATDPVAARRVALKILRPDDGARYARDTRARFTRELQIVANLKSPHTVTLFDGGETPTGLLYMVFELLPGEDLSALLQRSVRLEPATVLHIVWQLLDSLDEAHRLGLLHRDLKPANIRVFEHRGDPHHAKLLDFGLARDVQRQQGGVTATGQLIGTPRYMAPEQLTEKPLSPATDIYSLGLVAFEMLAGADALSGNNWGAQLERLRSGHVFSIPEIERVGEGLLTVIQRMTARRPEERYQSVAAVREALHRLQDPHATLPPKRHLAEPMAARPAARTHRLYLIVPAAIGFVVFLFVLSQLNTEDEEDASTATRSQRDIALTKAPTETTGVDHRGEVSTRDAGANPDTSMMRTDASTTATDHRSRGCGRALGAGVPNDGSPGRLPLTSGDDVYGLVPSNYDPNRPHPLVIALHQATSSPDQVLRYSEFATLGERDGAIVIAPEANPQRASVDDVREIRNAFEAVAADLCIDLARVYVAGHGRGGHLARRLMCEPWIAAVATSSFRSERSEPFCVPANGVRYMMVSPLKTDREPVEGGSSPCNLLNWIATPGAGQQTDLQSIEEAEDAWRDINSCSGKRKTTLKEGQMTCSTWNCSRHFESCLLEAGQGWPDAPPRELPQCDGPAPEFPLGPHIWNFLLSSPPHPSYGDRR